MKEYKVTIGLSKVEKINVYDIGKTIEFDIEGNSNYKATIKNTELSTDNEIVITCLLEEKIYNDFNNDDTLNNWSSFSIEKCIINGENLIDDYLCY